MPHIGDVAHIAHFVAQMGQVAPQHVKGHIRPRMAEVRLAVHRRTAHIQTHMRGRDGFKDFFVATEGVVKLKDGLHEANILGLGDF